MLKRLAILALTVVTTVTTFGACKIRLVYGESWSRAGRDVKKTMGSTEFKRLIAGKYTVDFVDSTGDKFDPNGNICSRKLPVIYVLDDKNRCFCMIESVPYNATPKWLFTQIDKVNKRREEIEKKIGTDNAEGCGQLLNSLEKFVGGPANVTKPGFYNDIYEKLQKLDPKDETGWVWHYTFGTELDRGSKRDGLEYVIKANQYRERKQFDEGDRWIESLYRKNRKKLTLEQQQSLLMAKFALHRENPAKKEEMLKMLEKISDIEENTLWGTCALGWLNIMGRPALSTYWGWKRGDFPVGKLDATIKFGVGYAFRRPGKYTIELIPDSGNDPIRVQSITLMYKDQVYKELKAPFEVDIDRQYAGKLTTMVLKGQSNADTSGKFRIHRKVLKPRKTGK